MPERLLSKHLASQRNTLFRCTLSKNGFSVFESKQCWIMWWSGGFRVATPIFGFNRHSPDLLDHNHSMLFPENTPAFNYF